MTAQEGDVFLGRFVFQQELGKGRYGRVFMAIDLADNSPVAVKMSPGIGAIKERNLIEAEVLWSFRRINSPHRKFIVNIKESFSFDDCVVLVLELLSHNLKKSINMHETMGSFSKISVYAKQMIEFLIFMQQMDVIHGDIKPENILVGKEFGEIKFADFGLSHPPAIPIELKMAKIQSLYYRSPEVILGYDYDASADVWSMGCVLMECLTGFILFEVKSELDLMLMIGLIVGLPNQMIISRAPNRDQFFKLDDESKQWVLNGLDSPLDEPMGLRGYLERYFYKKINVNDKECLEFVDFVGRMLRSEPQERQRPSDLFLHRFIWIAARMEATKCQ